MTKPSLKEIKNNIRPTLYWHRRRLERKIFFLKKELEEFMKIFKLVSIMCNFLCKLKGEFICRFFHKPIFFGLPTINKKGRLYPYNCIFCNNRWESYRVPSYYKRRKNET